MLKLNLAKRPCEPGHFHPIPTFLGLIPPGFLLKVETDGYARRYPKSMIRIILVSFITNHMHRHVTNCYPYFFEI